MGLNSRAVNEHGYGICRICRKKFGYSELETCSSCERLVCKNCATYQRQFPFGFICKACQRKN